MKEHFCWPIPIFEDTIDRLTSFQREVIIDHIDYLCKVDVGVKKSNVGGWQSSGYVDQQVPQFQPLLDLIGEKIKVLEDLYGSKLFLYNYWINVNQGNHYNVGHIHEGSCFSGVVYIDATPDQGSISFSYPIKDTLMYILGSIGMTRMSNTFNDIMIDPRTDKILIFPSFITHSVHPNNTDRPRISLAFNVINYPYPSIQSTP